jgi:ribosomal protein S18 acetylase RimI-like enzyme
VNRHGEDPNLCAVVIVPDLDEILDFCAREPVERVLLEDVARRGLGRFVGLRDGGSLTALCHVGANVVPSGKGCAAFAWRALDTRTRMVVGEEAAVAELWGAMRDRSARPCHDRPGQPVYAISDPPFAGETGLRPATVDDLPLLVPACAAAHAEEIGIDPLRENDETFRWRTRAQIEESRSWVWRERDTILFKAEASAWTPEAVQIQQVWVDPEVRGHGYAQRGMRDLCRLLLRRVPRVSLFVRPENAPAIRVYEAIGMRRALTFRSIIFG